MVLTGTNHKTGTVTNVKRLDINILKVDSSDSTKKLDGATFTLRKLTKNSMTAGTDTSFEQQSGTTADGGKTKFTGLVNGYYEIHETGAPAGYVLTNNGKIYIKVDNGTVSIQAFKQGVAPEDWKDLTLTDDDWYAYDEDTFTITAENTAGVALPSTGGAGTTLFTILGSILIALAGAGLVMRKKGRIV